VDQTSPASKHRIGGRLAVAVAVAAILLFERARPLRSIRRSDTVRIARNLGLGALSLGTASLLQGAAVRPLARTVERRRWGVVQHLPDRIRVPAAVLLFDYSMYLWHRLTHTVPALWRLHLVHHVEQAMDASTALRFHPADMAASIPWRVAQVVVIGAGPRELAAWQRLFFVAVLFHHANLRLPRALDRLLQPLIVTPRMHAIHHAPNESDTNSNWSSGLSIWDRLHGTLRLGDPPERTGIPAYPDPADARLETALRLPFVRQTDAWRPSDPRVG
jgi:sterol desaturase/sphingolipid hydroxylase (fatty acid hydroxylase superfamily)